MSLLVLTAADVSAISFAIPPDDLIHLMAFVFSRLSSRNGVTSPHRTSISTSNHDVLFMPGRIAGSGTAIKVVSVPSPLSNCKGLPASTFVIDEATGSVKAVINARKLTALRNAAGSVLATKLALGPSGSPKTLVVFGAGAQIEAHVDLLLRTYPHSLRKCHVFNRSVNARLNDLVASLRQRFRDIIFTSHLLPSSEDASDDSFKDILHSADIICTATSSTVPLFPGTYVKPGTHINLIGSYTPSMIEVDKDLINRADTVVVDSIDACVKEAGDLLSADIGRHQMIELGELIEVNSSYVTDGELVCVEEKCRLANATGDVTVFKSVGVGIQDVAIANLIVNYAEEHKIGTRIDNYDA